MFTVLFLSKTFNHLQSSNVIYMNHINWNAKRMEYPVFKSILKDNITQ